jgi:hypothetical protein
MYGGANSGEIGEHGDGEHGDLPHVQTLDGVPDRAIVGDPRQDEQEHAADHDNGDDDADDAALLHPVNESRWCGVSPSPGRWPHGTTSKPNVGPLGCAPAARRGGRQRCEQGGARRGEDHATAGDLERGRRRARSSQIARRGQEVFHASIRLGGSFAAARRIHASSCRVSG